MIKAQINKLINAKKIKTCKAILNNWRKKILKLKR